ncbi:MAG: fatty acid desaturase family protein, partial [Gammaproteobacteria bacterium]
VLRASTAPAVERLPSRAELAAALRVHAKPNTSIGTALVLTDLALYAAALAGVVFLPAWWMKFLAAIFAGLKISNLLTLAHDASHGSLTPHPRLNWLLGAVAITPALFNYRIWCYEHNGLHHPNTNGEHYDSYIPYAKTDFDRLPKLRQWAERFYRSTPLLLINFGVYYLIHRWWRVKLFPRAWLPAKFHASAWKHFAFQMSYVVLLLSLLSFAPLYSTTGALEAVVLGFIVPFFVWMILAGFTLYIQHTHPNIPWFRGPLDREALHGALLSVHLKIPPAFSRPIHNVYAHPVHHLVPGIPSYRLIEAQQDLESRLAGYATVVPFTLSLLINNMRACRLYDFESHRWLDFDGTPTTTASNLLAV